MNFTQRSVVCESLDNTRYFYAIINKITSNNNEY